MKLQNKKEDLTCKEINENKTNKETFPLESVVRQQNSKISHLLEKIDNLQRDNDNIMILLEELLYTISGNKEEAKLTNIEEETRVLQQLVKLN